jgi:hypothetical protein
MSSTNSWLIQGEPRCLHPLQEELAIWGSKAHFIFLRLHSQQLWVPLRTFLRFVKKASCDGAARDDIGSRRWVRDCIPAAREMMSWGTVERRKRRSSAELPRNVWGSDLGADHRAPDTALSVVA